MLKNNQVIIVTDSTSCIPADLANEMDIQIVPVVFIFGTESFRDGIDMTPREFYERLQKVKQLPKTSGALVGAYLEAYTRASKISDTILCITISKKFSGMFDSARLAKEMAKESLPQNNIEIIDCETAAGAQGLIVLAAARAAKAGKTLPEIKEIVKGLIGKVHLYAMLDTLSYLVRGGRAPRAAAIATSILHIKPILLIQNGEAQAMENVVTVNSALQRLFKLVEENSNRNIPLCIAVMHANAEPNARKLYEMVKERLNPIKAHIWEFTPVMGVHTGPGLVGVAFHNCD